MAGLAMSCRPVRTPPPPPPPGVRRGWRRGRLRPRRSGCHPLRRRRPVGGWGRRAWPGEGCPGRRPRPPGGGVGSGSAVAGPGSARPSARGRRGPRPRRPSRARCGRAHGSRGVKCYPGSVRGSACGPREVSVCPPPFPRFPTGSVGVHCGERPEVGASGAPEASGKGPGLVGRRSGRLCSRASS